MEEEQSKLPSRLYSLNDGSKHMNKGELIELVRQIIAIDNKTEKEIDVLTDQLVSNVPHPEVTDLIYYADLTPEEIVERALSYKPIRL